MVLHLLFFFNIVGSQRALRMVYARVMSKLYATTHVMRLTFKIIRITISTVAKKYTEEKIKKQSEQQKK